MTWQHNRQGQTNNHSWYTMHHCSTLVMWMADMIFVVLCLSFVFVIYLCEGPRLCCLLSIFTIVLTWSVTWFLSQIYKITKWSIFIIYVSLFLFASRQNDVINSAYCCQLRLFISCISKSILLIASLCLGHQHSEMVTDWNSCGERYNRGYDLINKLVNHRFSLSRWPDRMAFTLWIL